MAAPAPSALPLLFIRIVARLRGRRLVSDIGAGMLTWLRDGVVAAAVAAEGAAADGAPQVVLRRVVVPAGIRS